LQLLISFERKDNTTTRNRKKKNTETQLLDYFFIQHVDVSTLHTPYREFFSSTFFFSTEK